MATAAAPPSTVAVAALTTAAPAPKSSILGRGLSKEQRVCLLGLVALSLPPDDQALGRWNVLVLSTVARFLRLDDGHRMAPLLYSEGNDPAIRQVQLEAFRKAFFPSSSSDAGLRAAANQGEPPEPPPPPQAGDGRDGLLIEQVAFHALRLEVLRDLLVLLACAAVYDARSRRVLMALAADGFELDWREMARVRGERRVPLSVHVSGIRHQLTSSCPINPL